MFEGKLGPREGWRDDTSLYIYFWSIKYVILELVQDIAVPAPPRHGLGVPPSEDHLPVALEDGVDLPADVPRHKEVRRPFFPLLQPGEQALRVGVEHLRDRVFRVESEVFPPVDDPPRGRGVEELRGQVPQQRCHHIRHDRYERAGDLSLHVGVEPEGYRGAFLSPPLARVELTLEEIDDAHPGDRGDVGLQGREVLPRRQGHRPAPPRQDRLIRLGQALGGRIDVLRERPRLVRPSREHDGVRALDRRLVRALPEHDTVVDLRPLPVHAGGDRDPGCLQGRILLQREARLVPALTMDEGYAIAHGVKPPRCPVMGPLGLR